MRTKKFFFAGKYYSTFRKSLGIISIALLFLFFVSCDVNNGDDTPLPTLPDDVALFISIDDANSIGLRVINANSFELLDTLNTSPGVPWSIEFTPDYKNWFSCWGFSGNYNIYSGSILPMVINKTIPLQFANSSLAKDVNSKYLVAYIDKGVEIFDLVNLTSVKKDTTLSASYIRIAMSKVYNRFYFTKWANSHLDRLGIYDLDSMKTVDEVLIFDEIKYSGLEDVDLLVSNDDRYLFLSGWQWLGGFNGHGVFLVIDMLQKKIINEFRIGAFSQLAQSPDGQSVYISDPGGYLYMFPSTNKVWRYDVKTNSLNQFLTTPGAPDRIVVAEDSRTIFISSWQFIINSKHADIIKVDAQTGKIVSSYSAPLDSLGALTHIVRNIKIGKYLK